MAFPLVFFVVVCMAQGLALRTEEGCKTTASKIVYELEQQMIEMPTLKGLESVLETTGHKEMWNQAVTDACAAGHSLVDIIYCFREQIPNYIKLDARMLQMMHNATTELTLRVVDVASKYRKLIEKPLRIMTDTLRQLPDEIFNLIIKEKNISKALEAMAKAFKTVEDSSKMIGDYLKQMGDEVPAIVEEMEKAAEEIHEEYKKMSDVIKQEFDKCLEGRKEPESETEE